MLLDELYGLPRGRLTSFFQNLVWFFSLASNLIDIIFKMAEFGNIDRMLHVDGNAMLIIIQLPVPQVNIMN